MPANPFRALQFDAALNAYGEDDDATRCIDLLADARHWCDLTGQNFGDLDRQAYQHYLAELNDQATNRKEPFMTYSLSIKLSNAKSRLWTRKAPKHSGPRANWCAPTTKLSTAPSFP